jgi:hypothetical protein
MRSDMIFSRTWGMPNHETFTIPPIRKFVKRYLVESRISIDPYARNYRWCTHTNDLNPKTAAFHHLDAIEFLHLLNRQSVKADLVIIDPPYSPRQVKECYDSIGHKVKQGDTRLGAVRKKLKEAIMNILVPTGRVLTFGWNTVGMGKQLGFEIEEILLVCHGSAHNDTICLAESRSGGEG